MEQTESLLQKLEADKERRREEERLRREAEASKYVKIWMSLLIGCHKKPKGNI